MKPLALTRNAALLLALVTSPVFAGPPYDPANPPQGTFEDEWFVVELEGGKAGHAHATVTRDGNRITSQMAMKLSIRRGSAEVNISIDQKSRELVDGTPVGFDNTMVAGTVPVRTRGKIRDGEVVVREEQGAKVTTRTYKFDPDAKLGWGAYLEQRRHGMKPGTSFEIKVYDAGLRPDAPVIARVEVIGPEEIDLLGKKVTAIKVRESLQLRPARDEDGGRPAGALPMPGGTLVSDAWVDDMGTPLRTSMSLGGLTVTMVRAPSKEVATAAGKTPEMFLSMMIPVKGRVDAKADKLVYRLSVKEGELPDLPTTGMQRFERIDARHGRLIVTRDDWAALRKIETASSPAPPLRKYLQASVSADAENPKIQRLAREAVKDETSPAAKADRLRRFVTKYIKDKDFNVGFATATEVADSREGDCSEHGVLLAAMCRAAGMPARGVAGIVKVPGSDTPPVQFGYHMWTQVNINGRWVDIDAALRQTDCDPTHIALAVLDLNESGLADAALQFLPYLGRIQISLDQP